MIHKSSEVDSKAKICKNVKIGAFCNIGPGVELKEGMTLELTVGAIENEKFSAELEYIAPKGVTEEGTVKFEVRAAIKPTSETFLRAGYSASGDIILSRKDSVIVINERDLITSKDSDSIFVQLKVGDNYFKKTQIQIGLSDGILVEVKSGLDTTQQIKVLKNVTEMN